MNNEPVDALDGIVGMLTAGGPVVGLLTAMSVMALTVIVVKLWQLHAMRPGDRRLAVYALWLHRQGRGSEAAASLRHSVNPVAEIVAMALNGLRRGISEERIREELLRAGAERLAALRSWLRTLEVIAGLAPLLGLFGTVLGMIDAFRQLEVAGSQVNPSVLSGGIWEALLTTAVGLAVAMPVVAALNVLESRIERVAHDMDDAMARLFTQDLSVRQEKEKTDGLRCLGQAVASE